MLWPSDRKILIAKDVVFDKSKVNLHQIQNHKVRDEMKSCYSI
jgi:hypothetical protein